MAAWDSLKSLWGLESDPEITDASLAHDDIVEDKIIKLQQAVHDFTDAVVEVSSTRADAVELLQRYRDAVAIAYVALLDDKCEEAKAELQKVVNK